MQTGARALSELFHDAGEPDCGATAPTLSPIGHDSPDRPIVALDEFDLESAAMLREHFRLPGMGHRYGLLSRQAGHAGEGEERGIPVPEFSGVFHHDDLGTSWRSVPGRGC